MTFAMPHSRSRAPRRQAQFPAATRLCLQADRDDGAARRVRPVLRDGDRGDQSFATAIPVAVIQYSNDGRGLRGEPDQRAAFADYASDHAVLLRQ